MCSRPFVAIMAAARHSSLSGFRSTPRRKGLQSLKFKSRRLKRRSIGLRRFIAGRWSSFPRQIAFSVLSVRSWTDGSTALKKMCWPRALHRPLRRKGPLKSGGRVAGTKTGRDHSCNSAAIRRRLACLHVRLSGPMTSTATAEGLAGWLAGQPHVAASVKRVAGIKGRRGTTTPR